jgi:Flp pilus assembly protein TadG
VTASRPTNDDAPTARSRRASGQQGQALVEFALVLPVLMLLIIGIVKLGIVFNNYLTLNDAVRAGARQLAIGRGQNLDVCAQAINRVKSSASNLDPTKLQVPTPSVSAGSCSPGTSMVIGSDGTVSASYPCDIKIPPFIDISLTCSASTTERVE